MIPLRFQLTLLFSFCFFTGIAAPLPAPPAGSPPPAKFHPLVWDAMSKEYNAKTGESTNRFSFTVINTASTNVVINAVMPSCGCTIAQLPSQPWTLTPGTNGQIFATVNFAGKSGHLEKLLTVISSAGQQTLTLKLNIPSDPDAQKRQINMRMAMDDRQAVFKNDCASCHVVKGEGKMGEALFTADCAICHLSPHRAEMVTDLTKLQHPADAAFWKQMIAEGKEHSSMPAFGKAKGGPLSDEQIDSLVEYAVKKFPFNPANVKPTPAIH